MNAVLLCGSKHKEVDCINIDAILVKMSDGRTITLTEKSLMQADLARLDATMALPEWMRKKVDELRAGGAKVAVAR